MSAGPAAAATPAEPAVSGRRIVVAWLVLSAIATPLVYVYLGPALPPGTSTTQGAEQVFDNRVMTAFITPIVCLLAVFFAYVLTRFRTRTSDAVLDGPPIRGDARIQTLWVTITAALVLFLAGFGSYELLRTGAGGGQGPSPIALPADHAHAFPVQVIGQQWEFTYRYPSLGGFETSQLMLPAHTDVVLHVTSLDAVHSFWAVELGVKADANPGVDNVAYVETRDPRTFHVRCAELCGLWHGYMFDNGQVVDSTRFAAWAKQQQAQFAPVARFVPPYSTTYFPDPQRRAG